ncbi:hypothetical protein [Paraburkholderia humisilvae]|uniref:Uncharacterized protein n=1 Tax=Paraburkholderia humisilvae TaxID=627669 RepID=A0A6J5EDF1_9BURK|nr:hypothetical protein [Paraburkholderia humisilvae]CAB3764519.1 hypothetical protein LMG29542_04915 [Paraburkholderia humisilvae]
MASTNWNNGQLITLNPGDTATCQKLNANQIYGLIFYNSAGNDAGANISVVWSQSQPPAPVYVPGTTGNQGLASVLFVNGSDTTTVSAAMLQSQPGAQVQTYIASVKMPVDTSGINNQPLQADGQTHAFSKFTRYYTVPASHWYQAQIQSTINQFITIQFTEQTATVNVVNSLVDPGTLIQAVGSAVGQVTKNIVKNQTLSWPLQGNGQQIVFVNADSVQNSQSASISLQSLSALYS